MATIDTKFAVHDVFWVFDDKLGSFSRYTVARILITSKPTPEDPEKVVIKYQTVSMASTFDEVACLTNTEALEIGNKWLIDKANTIFAEVGIQ